MGIVIKTPDDIAKMREAGLAAAVVLDMIGDYVQPGISTAEIDRICHRYMVEELGVISACVGYHGFPKAICTSVNQVVCHGIPTEQKILKDGDIVNIDVTVIKDGWHGDSSRMYHVGKVASHAKRLIDITRECIFLGIEQVKPGARLGDIGHVIQQHAEKNHYSVVREYCGHGIGKGFHEEPQVLHYGRPGTGLQLIPGMVFTIEPMINAGKPHTKLKKDGWTVETADGRLSAQWEHMMAVTETGVEILTSSPKGLF
jgi:methionyl aminopeptidase